VRRFVSGLGGGLALFGALHLLSGKPVRGVVMVTTGAGLLVATAPWGWRR